MENSQESPEAMATTLTAKLRRTLRCEKDPELLQFMKRIKETENRFIALGRKVEKYAFGTEKLAQKGERISSSLNACCSHLKCNDEVKNLFAQYLEHLSEVQQKRAELKEILHDSISRDILAYEEKCGEIMKKVQHCGNALQERNQRAYELQKAKNRTPANPRKISEANLKYEKARCEADRSREDVDVEMKQFEEQKLADLNRILANFLISEMRFHAQALQQYTAAFRCLPLLVHNDEQDARGESETNKLQRSACGTTRDTKERRISFTASTERSFDLSISDLY